MWKVSLWMNWFFPRGKTQHLRWFYARKSGVFSCIATATRKRCRKVSMLLKTEATEQVFVLIAIWISFISRFQYYTFSRWDSAAPRPLLKTIPWLWLKPSAAVPWGGRCAMAWSIHWNIYIYTPKYVIYIYIICKDSHGMGWMTITHNHNPYIYKACFDSTLGH